MRRNFWLQNSPAAEGRYDLLGLRCLISPPSRFISHVSNTATISDISQSLEVTFGGIRRQDTEIPSVCRERSSHEYSVQNFRRFEISSGRLGDCVSCRRILGLSNEDVVILRQLRDAGL